MLQAGKQEAHRVYWVYWSQAEPPPVLRTGSNTRLLQCRHRRANSIHKHLQAFSRRFYDVSPPDGVLGSDLFRRWFWSSWFSWGAAPARVPARRRCVEINEDRRPHALSMLRLVRRNRLVTAGGVATWRGGVANASDG